MITGPRYKIAKRLGASVFEKAQTQKFAISAERKGKVRKGRPRGASEFGKQLLEKQKVRVTYGVGERQFSRYVSEAVESGHNPAERLHQTLELRLDNVLYRLGLAKTRRGARQMASHGHVTVNGKRITVPSAMIRPGDVLKVREGSRKSVLFEGFKERFAESPLASWLTFNPETMEGGVKEMPTAASADPAGDLLAVLSFYSR
ncbi:MAG: 30S ribosomal protein S4 [bacterium]